MRTCALSTLRWAVPCLMAVVVTGWTASARGAEIDGFTEPYRDVDIAASEMGRIVALEVSEGDRVTAGQVLARLDDDVLIASREIAKASMEAAGRLEGAKAELRMLQETLTQLQELLARNHATQREVDRAQTQVEMAEARLKAAQEELQVKTLEYQRSQTQLDQRRVVSSINGLVTQRYKDEGEFVSPTDPVVMRVVQLDQLLIVFSVPVAEAGKLTAKGTVRVRVDAVAQPIEGVVEFVSPTADAQSGTMRVRVRIANPNEAIPSGVTCHLLLAGGTQELAQATSPAVSRKQENPTVSAKPGT